LLLAAFAAVLLHLSTSSSAQTQELRITGFGVDGDSSVSLDYEASTSCYYRLLVGELPGSADNIVDMELGVDGARHWPHSAALTNRRMFYRIMGIPLDLTPALDADGDVLSDPYELWRDYLDGLDPSDADLDFDEDGLTTRLEFGLGTAPDIEDTDADTIGDGGEAGIYTDPLVPDVKVNVREFLFPELTSGISVLVSSPPGGMVSSNDYVTSTGSVSALSFTGQAVYQVMTTNGAPWDVNDAFYLHLDCAHQSNDWELILFVEGTKGARFLNYTPRHEYTWGKRDGLDITYDLALDESDFGGGGGERNKVWRNMTLDLIRRDPGNSLTNVSYGCLSVPSNGVLKVSLLELFHVQP